MCVGCEIWVIVDFGEVDDECVVLILYEIVIMIEKEMEVCVWRIVSVDLFIYVGDFLSVVFCVEFEVVGMLFVVVYGNVDDVELCACLFECAMVDVGVCVMG